MYSRQSNNTLADHVSVLWGTVPRQIVSITSSHTANIVVGVRSPRVQKRDLILLGSI